MKALFDAWRRVITRAAGSARRAYSLVKSSSTVAVATLAARYVRDPDGTLRSADAAQRKRLKEAGAAALAIGVALSFLVPASFGVPVLRRFLAAGWTAAWALARLFIMRATARGTLAADPRPIADAWGPALLPFAVAVVEPLGFLSLGVSAWLTARGLVALGTQRAEARWVVAWAFGGQFATEIVAWLARGGVAYLLTIAS